MQETQTGTSVSFLNHLEPRYSGLGDDTGGRGDGECQLQRVRSDLCPIRDDTGLPAGHHMSPGRGPAPGNDAATDITIMLLSPDNHTVHPDHRCAEHAHCSG